MRGTAPSGGVGIPDGRGGLTPAQAEKERLKHKTKQIKRRKRRKERAAQIKKREGKGKKAGKSDLSPEAQTVYESAQTQADLAYNPYKQEIRGELRRASAHEGVIDRAYDAYAEQLASMKSAQDAATLGARESVTSARLALEQGAGAQTERMAADANKRASLLGHSADSAEIIKALGGGAGASRASLGALVDTSMANIGLADYSDLTRRGATGERQRIADQSANTDYGRQQREALQSAKLEQGQFASSALQELIQQQSQNKIAAEGLGLDQAQFGLDQQELAEMIRHHKAQEEVAKTKAETARETQANESKPGSTKPSDLTPSERKSYKKTVNLVQAVSKEYARLRKQGYPVKVAKSKARRKMGGDRWMATVAHQMTDLGGLNDKGKKAFRGHLPGGVLPASYK